MRAIFQHKPQSLKIVILSAAKDLLLACAIAMLPGLPLHASAQTLARPGWIGSGIASEAWWRNAVFYRIDVKHFQDSDGDGTGDLQGITQRLDYLQSLGVDAIILTAPSDENGFDDLLREASGHRIRIVIALDGKASDTLAQARLWLTRGAAGISVLAPDAPLHDLRTLTKSFPGERVLLSSAASTDAELIVFPLALPPANADTLTASLRSTLTALQTPPASGTHLFESDNEHRAASALGDDAARSLGLQKIIAAQMLTSRGAVSLLYGQEYGLPDAAPATESATMQWTPTNITPPKPEPEPEEAAKPAPASVPQQDPKVYGAFTPYAQPKPVKKPKLLKPINGVVPLVDPDSLPGFTTAKVPEPKNETLNVAVEDVDPSSMLNFYRRLIQLHHDNPSLRTGTSNVMDHDAEKALVWIRSAPAGSRTAANVIITCNLNDKPLTLSLDHDLTQLHIHSGTLRPLLGSWTAKPYAQYSDHLVLPPYSVFIGELSR